MPKSTYLSNNFLNSALTNTPYSSPTNVYVAIYVVAPGPGGGGTEVSSSGTAYVREVVTFSTAGSGATANTTGVNFPVATSTWGTVVAFGIFDALSGGNLLYFSNLSTSRLILTGDQLVFPIGQLTCAEA